MNLPNEFAEWICSLSGCDGGNPKAKIWICGIEWGYAGKEQDQEEYYKTALPVEIAKGRYIPSETYDWKYHLSYPYGRSVAKLYSGIIGKKVEDYNKREIDCNGSEIFRLNLYPIAFNSTDEELWIKFGLNKITGFDEKSTYRTWCFLNRFPAISSIVDEYKPKLIIGTGIGYLTDFFACFAGNKGIKTAINIAEITQQSSEGETAKRKIYWAKLHNGITTLVVVPFFSGRYGLNSNFLLQEAGSIIKRISNF